MRCNIALICIIESRLRIVEWRLRIVESRLRILASRIALHIITDETVVLLGHHRIATVSPKYGP